MKNQKNIVFVTAILLLNLCLLAGFPAGDAARIASAQKSIEKPTPKPADKSEKENFAETYLKFLAKDSAAEKERFAKQMKNLEAFSQKFRTSIEAAQKKIGFDQAAARAEFENAFKEADEAKRLQKLSAFREKYSAQFSQIAQAAGINAAKERQQLISILSLGDAARIKSSPTNSDTVDLQVEGDDAPPEQTVSEPDVVERVFRAPFTNGDRINSPHGEMLADASAGRLKLFQTIRFAGDEHSVGFIAQTLPIESGVRRVSVLAELNPTDFQIFADASAGYASSEAIINLRVMEGEREVCRERTSLGRSIAVIVGTINNRGSRAVHLGCAFERPTPDAGATYKAVVELEGWTGGGGIYASAAVSVQTVLRQFQVYLHRR